jgi:hypothetical protein
MRRQCGDHRKSTMLEGSVRSENPTASAFFPSVWQTGQAFMQTLPPIMSDKTARSGISRGREEPPARVGAVFARNLALGIGLGQAAEHRP